MFKQRGTFESADHLQGQQSLSYRMKGLRMQVYKRLDMPEPI